MAEKIKIDASIIGIKTPIAVSTTYANVRAALVLNRDVIKSEDDAAGDDPVAWINANIDLLDRVAQYITKTLGLKAKQADKLQDLDVDELTRFSRTISAAILHMDMSDVDEADQKSGDEKSAAV